MRTMKTCSDVDCTVSTTPASPYLALCHEPDANVASLRTLAEVDADFQALLNGDDRDAHGEEVAALMVERDLICAHAYALHLTAIREPYVGKVTELTRELNDPFNINNPFAFDPDFCGYQEKKPYEMRKWKFGTITHDGIVVKANTREGLTALVSTMSVLQPVIDEFGLFRQTSHIFELTGDPELGGETVNGRVLRYRTFRAKSAHDSAAAFNWTPAVHALCSDIPEDIRVRTMLYQLAAADVENARGFGDDTPHRYGELVAWYLTQTYSPYKRELVDSFAYDDEEIVFPAWFAREGGEVAHDIMCSNPDAFEQEGR